MVRYKMVARDINASPIQYRTWVVENQPDFTGEFYTGLKSGDNSFVDVSAFVVYSDTAVVDFNLPNPLIWDTTKKVLPSSVASSQVAIIDGYAYLFGGKISARIYRADINNPADWEDTGADLPTPLYGAQLAIINDTIYLFGGNDGYSSDHIFIANVSDPLLWTDCGSLLPQPIQNSQVVIIDNMIHLLGGRNTTILNNIFSASITDPLVWNDTGSVLPDKLYSSQVAIIGNNIYLFGGQTSFGNPTSRIYSAPLNDPTNWNLTGTLPYAICDGQFFSVGESGYLITPGVVSTSIGTRILICDLSLPNQWVDTNFVVPGEVSESQLAIIYDRVFLFGGSGSSAIFANSSKLKYNFNNSAVIAYGNTTRTQYNNTPNKNDLFRVLGFPPWKTSYGA